MAIWKIDELGEFVTLKRGYDLPQQKRKNGEIPIFSSSGVTGTHNEAMVEAPGVITGRYGTIGEVFFAETSFWPLNTTLYVENFHENDEKFVYYFLKTLEWNKFASASAVPGINRNTVHKEIVRFPDFETQQKIASVLSTIDKKIAVNKAINDNLEQQAAALFSSLYNRSNTEVRYTDLIQILGGGTPKTGETAYWNGNIAFFTPKDVGTPYTFITEKTITEEGLSHCNSRLYPVNTVFVTARGTVGKVGLSGIPMAMNQSCYALVGKETHQLLVYFYTLKAVDRLKHKASGAVFDAITTRDFDSEQIMKLSDDDAKAFLCVAEPMFQEMLNNSIENLRLSTLRDFLLPKLMSGEIDVSSVQL